MFSGNSEVDTVSLRLVEKKKKQYCLLGNCLHTVSLLRRTEYLRRALLIIVEFICLAHDADRCFCAYNMDQLHLIALYRLSLYSVKFKKTMLLNRLKAFLSGLS